MLAEPTLATLSGRPATFSVGGGEGGMQLDIVPIVLGSGRVRLEYRFEITAPRSQSGPAVRKREAMPVATPFRLESAVELEKGKTCLIGHTRNGAESAAGGPQPSETLVMVRVDNLTPRSLR
jgi:pilus assembly protein CpaC